MAARSCYKIAKGMTSWLLSGRNQLKLSSLNMTYLKLLLAPLHGREPLLDRLQLSLGRGQLVGDLRHGDGKLVPLLAEHPVGVVEGGHGLHLLEQLGVPGRRHGRTVGLLPLHLEGRPRLVRLRASLNPDSIDFLHCALKLF